jgi:hypothetical protein
VLDQFRVLRVGGPAPMHNFALSDGFWRSAAQKWSIGQCFLPTIINNLTNYAKIYILFK